MACCRARLNDGSGYCDRCDVLVGLAGLHVISVGHATEGDLLEVTVESAPAVMACPVCGVVAHSHGRRDVALVDVACFGRPVRLVWRKRTWCCVDDACDVGSFTERNDQVALPALQSRHDALSRTHQGLNPKSCSAAA